MEYCETHPDEVSKAAEVQKKVDEVKGIMVENIERVLERGEKIELLVDKYVLFSFSSHPLTTRTPSPLLDDRLTLTPRTHPHRTDNLRFQADKFHKTGRTLRNKMWWQNFKVQLIVLLVVILIAVIIFCSVCFSTLPRPARRPDDRLPPRTMSLTPRPVSPPPPIQVAETVSALVVIITIITIKTKEGNNLCQ